MERALALVLLVVCDVDGFPAPSFAWPPEWLEAQVDTRIPLAWLWRAVIAVIAVGAHARTGWGDLLVFLGLRAWATRLLSPRPVPGRVLLRPLFLSAAGFAASAPELTPWDAPALMLLAGLAAFSLSLKPLRGLRAATQRKNTRTAAYDVLRQASKLRKRS